MPVYFTTNLAVRHCKKNSEDALIILEQAIMIDSEYGIKAAGDIDFESLRSDQRFKALTS